MPLVKHLILLAIISFLNVKANSQMVILSGPEHGSYSRFADDIVNVVKKDGISLINRNTGGSAYNYRELTNPTSAARIAMIQSDYMSLMEAQDWLNKSNKTSSLKVVMELAPEEIHFVARETSGFNKLQDLNNKKVAIGNEDQGSFATGRLIKERSKVNWIPYFIGFDELLKQLSAGNIDAFLLVGSAPVEMIDLDPRIMVNGGTLLELTDFNGWAKNYEKDTIRRGEYKWLDKDVPTFSVRTLLVVNDYKLTAAEKKTVEAMKSSIIANLDLLRKTGHPKWKAVIPEESPASSPVNINKPVKAVPAAASGNKDIVTYRIQIFSSSSLQKKDKVTISGTTYSVYVYSFAGAYRYTIGEFTSLSGAEELKKLCRESGYADAFIAAFRNNQRTLDPDLFK